MHDTSYRVNSTQTGFTIVELIALIIILGILFATAVPKLINLRAEANISGLQSMGTLILSNANLVNSKSFIKGLQNQAKTDLDIDEDGVNDVEIVYGYPSGHRINGIPKLMGADFSTEWTWSANASNTTFWLTTAKLGKRSGLYVNNTAVQASNCYILYTQATNSMKPKISYVTSGC